MNRSESPSTALRAPSPPLGEKDGMRGNGSWREAWRLKSPNKKGQACACPFCVKAGGTNYGLTTILVGGLMTMICPLPFVEALNVSVTLPAPVRTYFW